MGFIQIIEYTADDLDALEALDAEWEQSTEGKRTVRRFLRTRDRNNPGRYVDIVFFDSYESAMENSNLPETQAVAAKLMALLGAPTFRDLDVVVDKS